MTEHRTTRGAEAPELVEIRTAMGLGEGGGSTARTRLQELLDATGLWRVLGDLAAHAEMSWLKHVAARDPAMREMMARKVEEMKAELGGPAPSPLERLLVDRIAATWLMVHHADIEVARVGDGDLRRSGPARKRQAHAHRLYNAALVALATVRRLLPPGIS